MSALSCAGSIKSRITNSTDPHKRALMRHLIWIYINCKSIYFGLQELAFKKKAKCYDLSSGIGVLRHRCFKISDVGFDKIKKPYLP